MDQLMVNFRFGFFVELGKQNQTYVLVLLFCSLMSSTWLFVTKRNQIICENQKGIAMYPCKFCLALMFCPL